MKNSIGIFLFYFKVQEAIKKKLKLIINDEIYKSIERIEEIDFMHTNKRGKIVNLAKKGYVNEMEETTKMKLEIKKKILT